MREGEAYTSLMPKAGYEVASATEDLTRTFGLCEQHFLILCQLSRVFAVARIARCHARAMKLRICNGALINAIKIPSLEESRK